MLKNGSARSFFQVITESLKQDDKVDATDSNKNFIKVIDAIKKRNDDIFM